MIKINDIFERESGADASREREKRKYVKTSGVYRGFLPAGDAGACDSPAKVKIKKDAVASFLSSPPE